MQSNLDLKPLSFEEAMELYWQSEAGRLEKQIENKLLEEQQDDYARKLGIIIE